jgi:hypothetical protein
MMSAFLKMNAHHASCSSTIDYATLGACRGEPMLESQKMKAIASGGEKFYLLNSFHEE